MLSQFENTVREALESTPQERQLLRARSVVLHFSAVECRQRTEDFHKKSIKASRGTTGSDAGRKSYRMDSPGQRSADEAGQDSLIAEQPPPTPETIVDKKQNSPLNKAIREVRDHFITRAGRTY